MRIPAGYWLARFSGCGQGPGVLSIWLIGVVGAESVEQARTSGIMRFSRRCPQWKPVPAEPSSIRSGLTVLGQAEPLRPAETPHLLAYLGAITDPRAGAERRHPVAAMLALAAAAVLAQCAVGHRDRRMGRGRTPAGPRRARGSPRPAHRPLGGPHRDHDPPDTGPPGCRGASGCDRRVACRPQAPQPAQASRCSRRQDAARQDHAAGLSRLRTPAWWTCSACVSRPAAAGRPGRPPRGRPSLRSPIPLPGQQPSWPAVAGGDRPRRRGRVAGPRPAGGSACPRGQPAHPALRLRSRARRSAGKGEPSWRGPIPHRSGQKPFVSRATAVLLGGRMVGSELISPYPWPGRRR
jgi:hypothetical protein